MASQRYSRVKSTPYSKSDFLLARNQVAELLESARLLDDTSILFVTNQRRIFDRIFLDPEIIGAGSKGVQKFLIDCFQFLEKDVHEFLLLLGRKPDIKMAFQKIVSSKVCSEKTTHSSNLLDLQRRLLPLLFVLSHPNLAKSPLYTESNFLYSLAKNELSSLFSDYLSGIQKAVELKKFVGPTEKSAFVDTLFIPLSFVQGFYPMVKFLEILWKRFPESARESENRKYVGDLETCLLQWSDDFEKGALIHTKESKTALEIVLAEFKKVKSLCQDIIDVTEQLRLLRNRERDAKLVNIDSRWKDLSLEPPQKSFDNDHVNFRDIRLIPTMEEILFKGEFCLPGNLPFSSSAHWLEPGPERCLDTHFRLLRMDMISNIRLNLQAFIEHLQKNPQVHCGRFKKNLEHRQADFMVYTNAHVIGPQLDKFYGLCYEINLELPKIKADFIPRFNENQLQKDGLVCFVYRDASSKFQVQLHFAVIAGRDKECFSNPFKLPSNFLISFSDSDFDPLTLNFRNIYLLEFKGLLFESYRPILLALQKQNHLDLPFASVLCPSAPPTDGSSIVQCPAYLQDQKTEYSFDFLFQDSNLKADLVEKFCPRTSDLIEYSNSLVRNTSLDISQANSLLRALTTNVCCIQGPPGTGKTFIGVQIIKSLRQNASKRHRILLLSLTNHALDQFLCHLSNEGIHDMLRISTVKNDLLSKYDCQIKNKEKVFFSGLKHLLYEFRTLQQSIVTSLEKIKAPINQDAVCDYLRLYEKETVRSFELPLLLSGIKKSLEMVLDHWLSFKDLPSRKQKKNTKKVKQRKHKMYDSPFSTFSEIPDEFNETLNLDDIMNQLNEITMNDTTEPTESGEMDASPFENNEDSSKEFWGSKSASQYLDSDAKKWNRIDVNDAIPRSSIREEFTFSGEESEGDMEISKSLWDMELSERQALLNLWKERIQRKREEAYNNLKEELKLNIRKYQEMLAANMNQNMKHSHIIGITTTRASKNMEALRAWGPTIILCEEAGEILEAHTLASLSNSVKQLILIGDHKQLRPRILEYDLSVESRKGKQYRLDVSLFERLMDPTLHLPRCILQKQRRMKPIISQFIRKTIYPELEDGENVQNRPSIRGMQKDVFFMTHNNPQNSSEEVFGSLGHSNDFEVEMVASTIMYLLKQGYETDHIVVLTPYLSQLRLIKRKISNLFQTDEFLLQKKKGASNSGENDSFIRVSSVDNFQGEESDIVLISLVRSTLENGSDYGIGFLKIENRVNVLLSRAHLGMYLFGNAPLLLKYSKMWETIIKAMEEQDLIGEKLPIVCPNHPLRKMEVKTPKDFELLSPFGGCLEKCIFRLACGHVCTKICHIDDQDHASFKCKKPCETRFSPCNHRCPKLCHESCGKCEMIVNDILLPDCGHVLKSPKCFIREKLESEISPIPCHNDEIDHFEKPKCLEIVKHEKACGHVLQLPCHINVEKYLKKHSCHEKVNHTRQCGHVAAFQCSQLSLDPVNLNSLHPCNEIVKSVLLPKCNHLIPELKCHQLENLEKIQCKEKVNHSRQCGHVAAFECWQLSLDPVNFDTLHPCNEIVKSVSLPKCNHLIPELKCHQLEDLENVQCKENVSRTRICGHVIRLKCYENANSEVCYFICEKQRPCGHPCTSQCGQCKCDDPNRPSTCSFACQKMLTCFHICNLPCKDHTSTETACPTKSCKASCLKTECIHEKCDQSCKELCQPCTRPCTWTCQHQGSCPYPCGYPCLRLPCDLQCQKQLSCGHRCPSVCGEPCPSFEFCIECCTTSPQTRDENHLTLLRSYSNDVATSPLVILKCGHFFPMHILDSLFELSKYYVRNNDKWISFKYPEHGRGKFLTCPNCNLPVCVKDSNRYSRILKLAVLKNAAEIQFTRFTSNLAHAATSLWKLDVHTLNIQSGKIFSGIENLLHQRAENIFNSMHYELSEKILTLPLLDTFPNAPHYVFLQNFPQYLTLRGQYLVFSARFKYIESRTNLTNFQIIRFADFRNTMEESQELYDTSMELFFRSNARTRQIEVFFEETYIELDYLVFFLKFVEKGDFRLLEHRFKIRELQMVLDQIRRRLYYLAQMQDELRKWEMTYLMRFLKLYSTHYCKLAKIFEKKLGFFEKRVPLNPNTFRDSVTSVLTEHESLPKFRVLFSGHDVDFSNGNYIWLTCMEGHFYPISLKRSGYRKKCVECGAPIVAD